MNRTWSKTRSTRFFVAAAVAAGVGSGGAAAFAQATSQQNRSAAAQPRRAPVAGGAQSQRGAQSPRQGRAAPAPAGPAAEAAVAGGLDALTDDALFAELAGRGQDTLLERAFEVNKVPEAQRAGLRAFGALRELANTRKPPTASRRQALINQVAAGAKAVLPTMKDPEQLMEIALLLVTYGTEPLVNLLEYWGENPATQARLRPVAETVVAMYDKAAAEAEAAKEEIARKIKNANDKAADQWLKLNKLQEDATLTRVMCQYEVALSLPRDKEGMAARAKIVDAAIEALKEFDTEDSGVQPAVRLRAGKLLMAKGDYAAAREAFKPVAENKGVTPPADPFVQSQARYFSAVCDIETGDTARARQALNDLLKWQKQSLPGDETTRKRSAAAAEMMQYRIHLAEAAKLRAAGKAAEADKAQAAAVDVLMKLSNERPDLKNIISDQLAERVDIRRGVDKLDPLLLWALLQKGVAEHDKPEGEAPDPQVLARAVEAAQELIRRKGARGVDAAQAESAAALVPKFLERMGRKVEAANKYLEFLKAYPRSAQAESAFLSAGRLIVTDLRTGPNKGDKEVVDVWTRFLPIAIEKPYNRLDLAFDYAGRLRAQGKFREAAAYYARVPENDPRYVPSRYYQMVALLALLDQTTTDTTGPAGNGATQGAPTGANRGSATGGSATGGGATGGGATGAANGAKNAAATASQGAGAGGTTPAPARARHVVQGEERKQLAAEVLRLAEQARKLATDAMARAKNDAERASYQLEVAGATLTVADIAATEQNDPQKTLAALEGFEKEVEGLAGAREMLNRVLYLRVMSYMASNQLDKATAALADLQQKGTGREGPEIVLSLLTRLDADLEKAQAAGDEAAAARLAQHRADLSGYLVDSARKNPSLNKPVYTYSVYDAESKRLAGSLAKDPKRLRESLDAYHKLQSPEMLALYRKEVAGKPNVDPNAPNPNVVLGIGLTSFDLGDYKAAQENLGRLLVDKRLGGPLLEKVDEKTREPYYVDNEPLWEATYKFLRSNVELYKQNKSDANAQAAMESSKTHLKNLYIRGDVGGKKWKAQFEELRKEIIPEFVPPATVPSTQVATEPASAGDAQKQQPADGGGADVR